MRRADRLFRIVELMRPGRVTTARQLSERMEVSPRTIYRDMADLMASGVPIEGEAGTGYVMRPGYDLPPLMFTEAEIVALVAGARMARAWGGVGMAHAAAEALDKIAAVLPETVRRRAETAPIHAPAAPEHDPGTRDRIDRLERAADLRLRVRIEYRDEAGARTRRDVRPLGLWFWGKVWTLVAWCELREDFRMFRVDRVVSLAEGEPFRPEPGRTLADLARIEAERGACDGLGVATPPRRPPDGAFRD